MLAKIPKSNSRLLEYQIAFENCQKSGGEVQVLEKHTGREA